jgi:hypothetical protein
VEFRIGYVLRRAWGVFSRHFLTFLLLVGTAELLPRAPRFFVTIPPMGVLDFVLDALLLCTSSFAHAIVIFAAFQDLRGRPVSASESLHYGIVRGLPALAASMMSFLLMFAGLFLCVAPGLIALAAWEVVVAACVVERLGPFKSMKRSAALTKGHRWPILAVAVTIWILVIGPDEIIAAALPADPPAMRTLVSWAWQALLGSFGSVYGAILYHDLRAVKEGIGIAEIAAVFD